MDTVRIYNRNSGHDSTLDRLGNYQIWVGSASEQYEQQCGGGLQTAPATVGPFDTACGGRRGRYASMWKLPGLERRGSPDQPCYGGAVAGGRSPDSA